MTWRSLLVAAVIPGLLALAGIPAAAERDGRERTVEGAGKEPGSPKLRRAREVEKARKGRGGRKGPEAPSRVEGTPRAPAEDEPVPVRDPRRSTVTGPDAGAPPTVINPDESQIRITQATAEPDRASGERRVRIHFAVAGAEATHFRAVQVEPANRDAPFAGEPWRPYGGGSVPLPVGCGGSGHFEIGQVALQVKGPDKPNPNLPSQTVPNVSATAFAEFELPPELRSRITAMSPAVWESDEPVETAHGWVRPGRATSSRVRSWRLEVENHPGGLEASLVSMHSDSLDGRCFRILHVNQVHERSGRAEIYLDGRFDFDRASCQPEFVIGQCGVADPRVHARKAPLRFERVTTVHGDTADLQGLLSIEAPLEDQPGCEGFVEEAGDLSFRTASAGPAPRVCSQAVRLRSSEAEGELWRFFLRSSVSGQCGIGRTFAEELGQALLSSHPLYGGARRQSDFDPAYDTLPPLILETEHLDGPVDDSRRPWVVQHSCGPAGGSIRTWIDRAEQIEFVADRSGRRR